MKALLIDLQAGRSAQLLWPFPFILWDEVLEESLTYLTEKNYEVTELDQDSGLVITSPTDVAALLERIKQLQAI